jgi:HSP20 family protein
LNGGSKMTIKDLIPWKKEDDSIKVHQATEKDAMLDLRSQVNRIFDDFFENPFSMSPFFEKTAWTKSFSPSLDVSETDDNVNISAELPGLDPEDIHITVDHHLLTISGEKKTEKEKKEKQYYRVERSYGSFKRSVQLPDYVDEDMIDATFKNGVLELKLPKIAEKVPNSKRIPIKAE